MPIVFSSVKILQVHLQNKGRQHKSQKQRDSREAVPQQLISGRSFQRNFSRLNPLRLGQRHGQDSIFYASRDFISLN
jgi:hypothetical protein